MVVVNLDDLQSAYTSLRSHQQSSIVSTGSLPSAILILVTPDPDSLASAKILTTLLRCDMITFKIVPCNTEDCMVQAVTQAVKDESLITLFFINCGGCINLSSLLPPLQSRVRLYILDSHRPYNLANVDSEQIHIWHDSLDQVAYPVLPPGVDEEEDEEGNENEEEEAEIQEANRRRREEEENDEDDDEDEDDYDETGTRRADGSEGVDDDGSPSTKRRRRRAGGKKSRLDTAASAAAAANQPDRMSAAQSRLLRAQYQSSVRDYYNGGTYYGMSSAILVYELSSSLSRCGNEELWLCIIGMSDHFLNERVAVARYNALAVHLSGQLPRFNTPRAAAGEALAQRQRDSGAIASDALVTPVGLVADSDEMRFELLRHWTLYDSLLSSPYSSTRLSTWTDHGRSCLRHLLTDIGIKTTDAQQKYRVMDQQGKSRIDNKMEEAAQKERYKMTDVRFKSFTRQLTTTIIVSACDMVHSLTSLLELPAHDARDRLSSLASSSADAANTLWEAGFWKCWSALEPASTDKIPSALVTKGVDSAIYQQTVIFTAVSSIMASSSSIHPGIKFRWVQLSEDADSVFLSKPLAIVKLGRFLFEATRTMPKGPKP